MEHKVHNLHEIYVRATHSEFVFIHIRSSFSSARSNHTEMDVQSLLCDKNLNTNLVHRRGRKECIVLQKINASIT